MTEKQLIMNCIMTFLLSLATIYFICEIVARIKNKTPRRRRKQIVHKTTKTDLCRNLLANMQQEFIGERKMIFNELVRM